MENTAPTWGSWLWDVIVGVPTALFLIFEIYALCTNPANTLSAWVWRALKVTPDETFLQWHATAFLVFGCWIVLVTWLTGHFFFGLFR